MRRWILSLLGLLVLAASVPLARAQQQTIYRCIGAHGEPVFSGQPCGTPAPAPGTSNAAPAGVGSHCAVSPQALRQAIAAAFTAHNANRLAGLLVWRGIDQASARARLQVLAAWLREPLSGIVATYANGPPDPGGTGGMADPLGDAGTDSPDATEPGGALTGFAVSTGGGDGSTRDFGVVQSGGCWWLTF